MAGNENKGTQAERLIQLRRDKGLTAEQLAQLMTEAGAKVSRGAISNWERGTNGIVSSKLPTLARILGCSEGYLLRGELQAETNRNKESQQDTKAVGANKEQADAPSAAISSNQKPYLQRQIQTHKTTLCVVTL